METDLDLRLDESTEKLSESNLSELRKKKWTELLKASTQKDISRYWNIGFYIILFILVLLSSFKPSIPYHTANSESLVEVKPQVIVEKECPLLEADPVAKLDTELIAKHEEIFNGLHFRVDNITEHITMSSNSLASVKALISLVSEKISETKNKLLHVNLEEMYDQMSGRIQSLENSWQSHSALINDLKENLLKLKSTQLNTQLEINVTKMLKAKTVELERRLNETLQRQNSLDENIQLRTSSIKQDLVNLANSCESSIVMSKIDTRLNELIRNQSHVFNTVQSVPQVPKPYLHLVDYASIRHGGQIVPSRTSSTYLPTIINLSSFKYLADINAPINFIVPPLYRMYSLLGIDIGVGKPEDALSEEMELGSCWPLQGTNGQLTVKLRSPIYLTSVSIDHIPRNIASDPRSAPNSFKVSGSRIVEGPYTDLVSGNYLISEGPETMSQTFAISPEASKEPLQYITLNILSNHGHSDYTCLYRFRVHGSNA